MKKILPLVLVVAFLFASCMPATNGGAITSQEDSSTSQEDSSTSQKKSVSTEPPEITELKDVDSDLSTKKIVWGPGKITDHVRPTDPVNLQAEYEKYNAQFVLDDEKKVLLTFDEGYENGFTPSILDTLKEKNVKAVFFVTYDFARDNPDLIKRIIDEGHVLGNHTYRHKTMDEIDTTTATEEVQFLHNYIRDTYGYTMTYFRFPKGEFSAASLSLVSKLGYKSMFWSFAYEDWNVENPMDKDKAFQKITEATHNGAIFLLHAVSKTNAEILGAVIANITAQGYSFVDLSKTK